MRIRAMKPILVYVCAHYRISCRGRIHWVREYWRQFPDAFMPAYKHTLPIWCASL